MPWWRYRPCLCRPRQQLQWKRLRETTRQSSDPRKQLRATNVHVPPCHPICDCCPEESHEFLFEETACVSKGEVSCGLVLFLFAAALVGLRMLLAKDSLE